MNRKTLGEVQDESGTHREVWDRSENPRGGPGLFGRPSGRFSTDCGPLVRFKTGQETLGEVWDGSEDPRGGPGWVGTLG